MRFLYLFFVFFSCSNTAESIKEFISLENLPIETIINAEILHSEKGKVKVKIIAGKIERYLNTQPQLLFIDGINITFYDDSANVKSTLIAERAEIDEVKKIMTASKNVLLISSNNKKLETEILYWDEKRNRIYTDNQVFITTNKETIVGDGFISNPDFTEYSISNISGIINLETATE